MLSEKDKTGVLTVLEQEKEQALFLFKKLANTQFGENTKLLMCEAEKFDVGFGFSIKPYANLYDEVPIIDENGKEQYIMDGYGSFSIAFDEAVDWEELESSGDPDEFFEDVEPIFLHWLHELWTSVGRPTLKIPLYLLFHGDYPNYYNINTGKYEQD
jgi:hypothetical protein